MKRTASLALAVVLFTCASGASAQSDKVHAKEAYDRGTQAHARGDFRAAAQEFARADALAPSNVALQAALDAAVDADDFVLGAELLERSRRVQGVPAAAPLAASIDAATKKLAGRAGHLKVACPNGARCTGTIDGAPFDATKGAWMRAGPHTLVVQVDGTPDTRTVEIRAGESMEVVAARASTASPTPTPPTSAAPPAPASPTPSPMASPTAPEPSGKPLSPIVFWIGTGVTVVLGGATTYFALTASSKHGSFVDTSCGALATTECTSLKDSGERAQTFANVGFAATGIAAVTTIAIGVLFTDWSGSKKTARAPTVPVVVPVAGGMAASWERAF